jgi:hypothetical protein
VAAVLPHRRALPQRRTCQFEIRTLQNPRAAFGNKSNDSI